MTDPLFDLTWIFYNACLHVHVTISRGFALLLRKVLKEDKAAELSRL